jgi:hypothetical protein
MEALHPSQMVVPSCPVATLFWARSQNNEKRLLASSRLSIHPSDRMEQLSCHWMDFD